MRIRKLKNNDADNMLEWMHDEQVVEHLKKDFSKCSLSDCERFIDLSLDSLTDIHYAIVNDNDEYMGTVSLKNISDQSAELGIVIRKCAMGKGYSQFGLKQIFKIARDKKIKNIYWCVDPDNHRAIRFYEKLGFKRINNIGPVEGYSEEELTYYVWFNIYLEDTVF